MSHEVPVVEACRGFSHDLQHALASGTQLSALLQQDLFTVAQHGSVRQATQQQGDGGVTTHLPSGILICELAGRCSVHLLRSPSGSHR